VRAPGHGILLLVVAAALACAGPSGPQAELDKRAGHLKQGIAREIDDPDRVASLCAVIDRLDANFDEHFETLQAKRRAATEASRRYDATDDELRSLLSELRDETLALRTVLVNGHYELREMVSEEEWRAILRHQEKVLGLF